MTTGVLMFDASSRLTDHPLLLVAAGVLAVAALFLLVVRGSIMFGFVCVVLLVVLCLYLAYPDIADRYH